MQTGVGESESGCLSLTRKKTEVGVMGTAAFPMHIMSVVVSVHVCGACDCLWASVYMCVSVCVCVCV